MASKYTLSDELINKIVERKINSSIETKDKIIAEKILNLLNQFKNELNHIGEHIDKLELRIEALENEKK